jgi:hypothetical protein
MSADCHLISHWRVKATLGEVAAVLRQPRDLVRWWPEVHREVRVDDEGGADQVVHVHSRGRPPYTLRWSFREVVSSWPHGATIEAFGDLSGRGVWTLEEAEPEVRLTYDSQVSGDAAPVTPSWPSRPQAPTSGPVARADYDARSSAGRRRRCSSWSGNGGSGCTRWD